MVSDRRCIQPTLVASFTLNCIWTTTLILLLFFDYYLILGAKQTLGPFLTDSIKPSTAPAIAFLLLILLSISGIVQCIVIHVPYRWLAAVAVVIEFVAFGLTIGLGAKVLRDIETMRQIIEFTWTEWYPSPPDGLKGVIAAVLFFELLMKLFNMVMQIILIAFHRPSERTTPASHHHAPVTVISAKP